MLPFIEQNEQIQFMIPAFPFKSPSSDKCLGKAADKAEEESFKYLKNICDEVKEKYKPGAKINIFSDGRIFADITTGVTDNDVTEYTKGIKKMINDLGASDCLNIITLEDEYKNNDYCTARNEVRSKYGQPLEEIEERINEEKDPKKNPIVNDYTGIKRFVEEELKVTMPEYSKKARQRTAKQEALKTIQAAEAWTCYMKDKMPKAIRLSSHPQPCGSSKFGIYISKNAEDWSNPWNATVVELPDGKFILTKCKTAENCGLNLVRCPKGLPSHFKCTDEISKQTIDELRRKK